MDQITGIVNLVDQVPNGVKAPALALGVFAVFIRPAIPQTQWAKLGVVGRFIDGLCGNFWHTKNA